MVLLRMPRISRLYILVTLPERAGTAIIACGWGVVQMVSGVAMTRIAEPVLAHAMRQPIQFWSFVLFVAIPWLGSTVGLLSYCYALVKQNLKPANDR